MDSSSDNSPPDPQRITDDLVAVCGRIAAALERLERLYAAEVEAQRRLRQQAEEEQQRWQERQRAWGEQETARAEEGQRSAELQRQYEDAMRQFTASLKPPRWEVQLLWVVAALVLLALCKASVAYLLGYWPTP